MANSAAVSKIPLFRTLAARGYASQPAVAAALKSGDIQTTTLPNKLVVSSTETGSAISRISIAFNAGSRNETHDNLGAAHIIRVAAGLSTKYATTFGITRNVQQIGGSLSVTADRELLSYTIEVTRDNLETALQCLEKSVTGQVFKPWEISDSTPRVKLDLANVSSQVRAVELLHQAAYRTGLGNSLFCPDHKVGKISSETLQHFYESNFTANRGAVSGVNIDHQMLLGYAQSLQLGSGEGAKNESKYHGGADVRCERGGNNASVAVATSGAGWANLPEGIAFAVLQRAAGVGPATKWGQSAGVLVKAIQAAAPKTGATTLNASYSDSGLFGFVVSGPAKEAGIAVEAGIKALKSASLSDEDIARGKAQLKSELAFVYETDGSLIQELGVQGIVYGNTYTLKGCFDAIDAVQAADIKSAARKLSNKVSIGAVGNLEHVPYAADLN